MFQRFVQGKEVQGDGGGADKAGLFIADIQMQTIDVVGRKYRSGLGKELFCIRRRKLKGKLKSERSALSFDEIKTEGAQLLPAGEAPFRKTEFLLLFFCVEIRMKMSVNVEGIVSDDTALYDEKRVEGLREQELIHKVFDILNLK